MITDDKTTRTITKQAVIAILVQVVKKEDDTCKGVELLFDLFVGDPNVEIAKKILNIYKPSELEAIYNAKALPEC